MGSAMKQLHYHAQKNLGDSSNAALFQAVLRAARGTQDALRYDDAVPYAMPGDGGLALQRDNWIAMDIPAKLTYLRKHRPVPLASGSTWRLGNSNHYELVGVDGAGNPVVDGSIGYGWTKHWPVNEDRTLSFQRERAFEVDMRLPYLLALNTPPGALSWLGTAEKWLPLAMKIWPEVAAE
jgi:hypothetical protein